MQFSYFYDPFLSDIMNEMQEKWKEEWEKTSKHRFRSPEDMQYAFAYYYYVIHRHKAQPPDVLAYIKKEVLKGT